MILFITGKTTAITDRQQRQRCVRLAESKYKITKLVFYRCRLFAGEIADSSDESEPQLPPHLVEEPSARCDV